MFLKKFDYLSYPLTLYFNNYSSHSSIISGIITIITYLLCFILTIYVSKDFLFKENPNAYTYNKVIYDAGLFPLNSSSMFHFVYISPSLNINEGYFEIFGILNNYVNIFNDDGHRINFDHYMYKPCVNIKVKDNKIHNLIDFELYNTSFCISSFYNSSTKDVISINDKKFIYPILSHGMSHPNRTYYGIFFQKCINSTLNNNNCKSEKEINSFMSQQTNIGVDIINQEIDVKNYKEPFVKSFYKITSGLSEGFTANHLNFQPLIIKSHDKIFLSNKAHEEVSYIFEENERQEWKSEYGIFNCVYLWMQNKAIIFERNYKRLENVLADAGGIIKILITIGTWINYFFAKFITYRDINLIIRKYIDIHENLKVSHFIKLKNSSIIKKNLDLNQITSFSQYLSTKIRKNNNNHSTNLDGSVLKLNNCLGQIQNSKKNKNKNNKKHVNIVESPSNIKFRRNRNLSSQVENSKITFKDYFKWIINNYKCTNNIKKNRKQVNYLHIIEKYYQKIISEEEMFYLAYEVNYMRNYVNNVENDNKNIHNSGRIIDKISSLFKLN